MEILILIGIFAFVIAIIFRSNEALDRVGEVEKEVKAIEEELVHSQESQRNTDTAPTEQSTTAASPEVVQGAEQPQAEESPHPEPEVQFSAGQPASAPQSDSPLIDQPLADTEHAQPVEPSSFPSGNNIRMS